MSNTTMKLTEIDGILFPSFITRERFEQIREFVVRPEDVFVATYPKCGTTWVQEIVRQIYNNGERDDKPLSLTVPWFELGIRGRNDGKVPDQSVVQQQIDALPSPRLLKTHLSFRHMPPGVSGGKVKCKCIYVMRNPKDVTVSAYHHVKGFVSFQFDNTFSDYFQLFMESKVESSSWYDHTLGWWQHKDDPNILFLKYEELKKDLGYNVRVIAEFLGKDLSQETIGRIAEQCTFDVMKRNPATNYSLRPEFEMRRKPNSAEFIRKGEVGDWKNYFTTEQNEAFDKQYEERMAGSGLEFEFGA